MSKRRWTNEEINDYRKRNGTIFYYNKEDANLLIPKTFGFGWTLNWANPISWLIILVIVGVIFLREMYLK